MPNGIVLYVKDLAGMTAFYAAVTGIAVSGSGRDHSELGADLVLVAMPARIAATVTLSDPSAVRESTSVKPFFEIDSIEQLRPLITGLRGGLNPAAREWRFRDWTVCDGHDPEGNVIQFRQRSPSPKSI